MQTDEKNSFRIASISSVEGRPSSNGRAMISPPLIGLAIVSGVLVISVLGDGCDSGRDGSVPSGTALVEDVEGCPADSDDLVGGT